MSILEANQRPRRKTALGQEVVYPQLLFLFGLDMAVKEGKFQTRKKGNVLLRSIVMSVPSP
jgi:hypothetical protein